MRTQPVTPAVRETARIFIDVQNRGRAAVPRNTVTPLAIRVEGPSKRIDMVSGVYADGLAPGESTTITQFSNGPWINTLEMSSDKPGTFTIAATVDRDNGIEEGDELNNAFTHRLTYPPPPSLATYALERSVRSYASVAPVDSVVALLRGAQQLDSAGNQAVVKGVTKGWGSKRKAGVRKADRAFVNGLSKTVPVDNREEWNALLQAWGLRSAPVANPDATVIRLRVVPEALQFDRKEFSVTAGKPVEITFENPDAMQHNVVIGKPASLEIIGAAADKMITAPDGAERSYVPSIPQVLFATKLVDPNGSFRLQFTAPSQPGDYPFVCTFPGHWRVMNGVMKVKPGKTPSKP